MPTSAVPNPFSQTSDDQSPVETLLSRMRGSDRLAAAQFIKTFEARIRRRIRGKLHQPTRRVFDSEEIFSTVLRRLDHYVSQGRLAALSQDELWSLVFKMADNAVIDKVRTFKRLEMTDLADENRARVHETESATQSLHPADVEGIEIDRALRALPDPIDRRIVQMILDGETSTAIARETHLSPSDVRKHWERIRKRLRRLASIGLL